MDKNSGNVKNHEKVAVQQTSLTPAVLGIPSGVYGIKLPPNANSKYKEELLVKLNQWRQTRRDKLVASIFAKRKQSTVPEEVKVGDRTASSSFAESDGKHSRSNGKKSVFDRLYENGSKHGQTRSFEASKTHNVNSHEKYQNSKALKSTVDLKVKAPATIATSKANEPESSSVALAEKPELQVEQEKRNIEPVEELPCLEQENVIEEIEGKECIDQTCSPIDKQDNGTHLLENWNDNKPVETVYAAENVGVSEDEQSEAKNNREVEPKCVINEEKSFKVPKNSVPEQRPRLRRSISAMFRSKRGNYQSAIHRSSSENNLMSPLRENESQMKAVDDSGVTNNKLAPRVDFKKVANEKANVKKSVCFLTPTHKSTSASHLRNELEKWLSQKGHSIDTYRHLGCFGLGAEGTPVVHRRRQPKPDDSLNASFYSTAPNTPIAEYIDESDKENVTPPVFVPKVDVKDVEGWLSDLLYLIVEMKYPRDRCEEWLNAISRKYPNCKMLPIYWECEAAMNGDPDDLKTNSETEENKVDEEIDVLVQNFNKLVVGKQKSPSKIERGLSVDNIFRSKTVKLALKEKEVKQMDLALGKEVSQKVLVATPVRRSARLQTPDKSNTVTSLKSLDPKTRNSVAFKINDALIN